MFRVRIEKWVLGFILLGMIGVCVGWVWPIEFGLSPGEMPVGNYRWEEEYLPYEASEQENGEKGGLMACCFVYAIDSEIEQVLGAGGGGLFELKQEQLDAIRKLHPYFVERPDVRVMDLSRLRRFAGKSYHITDWHGDGINWGMGYDFWSDELHRFEHRRVVLNSFIDVYMEGRVLESGFRVRVVGISKGDRDYLMLAGDMPPAAGNNLLYRHLTEMASGEFPGDREGIYGLRIKLSQYERGEPLTYARPFKKSALVVLEVRKDWPFGKSNGN